MKFPTAGGQTNAWRNTGEEFGPEYGFQNLSWTYQILPFLEQQALFNKRLSDGYEGGDSPFFVESRLPFYTCPSRGERGYVRGLFSVALSDYAGFIGNWNEPGWENLQFSEGSDPMPGEIEFDWTGIISKGYHVNFNGDPSPKITKYPKIGFGSVQDGSSNTIMFMEKAVPVSAYNLTDEGGNDFWIGEGQYQPGDFANSRMVVLETADDGSTGNGRPSYPVLADSQPPASFQFDERGRIQSFGFGSAHPGTMTACFGDGSVTSISLEVSPQVLNYLGKRADGTVTGAADIF